MSGESPVEVSVIVPCYRAGKFLPRFVAALKAQDFTGCWEAVFVDDGDPEGESAYACVDDSRFRVVRRPHAGVSAARNAGLAATSGEIVLFADPDDEPGPSWMTHLVRGLDGVDLAWTGCTVHEGGAVRRLVPEDVGAVYRGEAVRRRAWRAVFGYRLRDVLRWWTPQRLWRGCRRELGGVWCRAFRRSVLGDLRFDESLALYEDAVFVSAYSARAGSMRILGDADYEYFIRSTGGMSVGNRKHKAAAKFALRDARARLDPDRRFWRGTFWLSAVEVAREAGLGVAWRYLTGGKL